MNRKLLLAIGIGFGVILVSTHLEHSNDQHLFSQQTLNFESFSPSPVQTKPNSLSMTLERLETLLQEEPQITNLQGSQGQWEFLFDDLEMAVLTSPGNNRMRIISPIIGESNLTSQELRKMLAANFHTALDARYATSNGIVFSTFIHPLSSLQDNDFRSALYQVHQLVKTFGTTYSSGGLQFGQPQPQEDGNLEI